MSKTILVIDDEPDLIKLVDYNLTKEGFLVLSARDGKTGIGLAHQQKPDLILLDIMLPEKDGWEVCRELRTDRTTHRIPIIMLTAKAQESDRIVGLELGADDYVTKPFSIRELTARIRAILRRFEASETPGEVIKLHKIVLDAAKRQVTVAGKLIDLTMTEFDLLKTLASRPGRVMSRDELLSAVRGDDAVVTDRTIDVHITSLRKKLGRMGELVETVRGVGYRFRE